ncbi:hypothetical protein WDZ92_42990 [Nostoc sp. NIES-2111]
MQLGASSGRDVVLPAWIVDVHFLGSVIRLRAPVGAAVVVLDAFNRSYSRDLIVVS